MYGNWDGLKMSIHLQACPRQLNYSVWSKSEQHDDEWEHLLLGMYPPGKLHFTWSLVFSFMPSLTCVLRWKLVQQAPELVGAAADNELFCSNFAADKSQFWHFPNNTHYRCTHMLPPQTPPRWPNLIDRCAQIQKILLQSVKVPISIILCFSWACLFQRNFEEML